MNTRRILFFLIMAGQFLLLGGMIVRQEYRLYAWQTIRLRVLPVDPVSLFRGRYVVLTYDFSRSVTCETDLETGDTVYVRLTPGADGLWRFAECTPNREPQPGSVFLRGRVRLASGRSTRIDTDIESYFLSERQAPQIERLSRVKYEMTVDVVVAEDGRVALKQLYVQGIPAEEFDPTTTKPAARINLESLLQARIMHERWSENRF